jgi:hypothetical protein
VSAGQSVTNALTTQSPAWVAKQRNLRNYSLYSIRSPETCYGTNAELLEPCSLETSSHGSTVVPGRVSL